MSLSLFAACTPGLEKWVRKELDSLGLISTRDLPGVEHAGSTDRGGVSFQGDLGGLYRANLNLRTASRILLRIADFRAIGFSELRKKASQVEWERYIEPGQTINLRVTCHKSRLYHSDGVAERVASAIRDRLGEISKVVSIPDENKDIESTQIILVRLAHDHCTISLDSSGNLLHRRGYRQAVAKAPLRETLAAGILMASGWDLYSPLLDPFSGSGTIPIEAACMARRIPPGFLRSFAFMNWKNFDAALWDKILAESRAQIINNCPPIMASDRDAGAIEMAQANAQRAGVENDIRFSCRAISAIEPMGLGWVVTNPPYGLRVSSDKDLRNLYAQLGNVLRKQCPGWHVAILSNNLTLLHQTELALEHSTSLLNGGVKVLLAKGVVPG